MNDAQFLVEIGKTAGYPTAVLLLIFLYLRPQMKLILETLRDVIPKKSCGHNHDDTMRLIEIDSEIRKICTQVKDSLGPDRIHIFLYHNSYTLLNGFKFLKTSCLHEDVKSGTMPQQHLLQDLPVSMFAVFNSASFTNKGLRAHDIEWFRDGNPENGIPVDHGMYEFLKQQGVISLYSTGLSDSCGTAIGFFVLYYCKNATALSNDDFINFDRSACRISSLLTVKKTCSGNGLV